MSEISEPGIMVNYETKLLAALKGFQENYRDLADFTIIARNHEEYKSHKLLLAVRSKYFEALFRTEPEKKSVKLDFDGQILEIILKSLVSIDDGLLTDFEVEELLRILEASDYLQMEDYTCEVNYYYFLREINYLFTILNYYF